ncbi:MAG: hypothetical protein ABEN55_19660, partial [Bradymonadaceae bacterium]
PERRPLGWSAPDSGHTRSTGRRRSASPERRDGELEETDNYVDEKGRLRNQDFDPDRAGRSFKGGSRS